MTRTPDRALILHTPFYVGDPNGLNGQWLTAYGVQEPFLFGCVSVIHMCPVS